MKKRNIVAMVFLYLLTFGIYPLVWTCSFQSELKARTGNGIGGAGHFFMLIFTFGIYNIYWQYAAGKRLAMQGAADRSVIYLILGFVFPILNPFLMQDQANKLA